MEYKNYQLSNICKYRKEKIVTTKIKKEEYISTENMLANKQGIEESNSLPQSKSINRFEKKDILISNIRPYFKKIWFSTMMGGASPDVLIFKADQSKVTPEFLYYLLSQEDFFNYMVQTSKGTKMPRGDKDAIMQYKVKLFNKEKQWEIVNILSSLDEKVQNNKLIISKLEEISQTLFKQWFIDFEFPNEEGKPYKSSGGEMVESELGEIPKGWDILKLSDITTLLKRTFNPSKTEVTEVLHFSLPAFDKEQLPTLDEVSTIRSNKWILEENCVVFSKMNPKTPRIWLTNINDDLLNVASSEFVVLRSENAEDNSFIYNLCKFNSFNEYLISNSTGSTNSRQRVTPTIALNYKSPLDRGLIRLYGSTTVSISEKIKSLNLENEKLQQLRDTLLPKLLSGEIEIPDELEV